MKQTKFTLIGKKGGARVIIKTTKSVAILALAATGFIGCAGGASDDNGVELSALMGLLLQPGQAATSSAPEFAGGTETGNVGVRSTINGTSGNDTLIGSDSGEIIYGYDGNDHLSGKHGDDWILGGNGDDQVHGGHGSDTLWGEDGDDGITGLDGNDNLFGGNGNDYMDGDRGNDLVMGGNGDDTLFDDSGNDTYYGGSGNDTLKLGTDFGHRFFPECRIHNGSFYRFTWEDGEVDTVKNDIETVEITYYHPYHETYVTIDFRPHFCN